MSNPTSDFLSLMDRLTTQYKNEVFWVKFITQYGELRIEVYEEDKNIDEVLVIHLIDNPSMFYLKEIAWNAPQMNIGVSGIHHGMLLAGDRSSSEEICYMSFIKIQ